MRVGFIGLGDMGGPIAANIASGGTALLAYDKAGTRERAPEGSDIADNVVGVASEVGTIILCVPDGDISETICRQIIDAPSRKTSTVIDLSTIGVRQSQKIGSLLADADMVYVDSPVSGGRAGAHAGTITVIWSGPAHTLETHRAVIESMSGNIFQVGTDPGKGQAMKLLNNFLSATAMAATAEATIFGLSQGLDFGTMLDVLNVSTGMNTATKDKYPNRIVTGTFDAGFRSALMRKDMRLYLEGVAGADTPNTIGTIIDDTWHEVDQERPGSDITEVFRFLRGEES